MDKYACVTGADRGLGLEIAEQLVQKGFYVFAGKYLNRWDLLDKLKEKYPDRVHIIEVDVSSDDQRKKTRLRR